MEKVIQNEPNDMIAVICNVKVINADRNEWTIEPIEVAFGRLDYEENFIPEGSEEKITDVLNFENNYKDENTKFYLYPISLQELKTKYSKDLKATFLAKNYFEEIKKKFYLLYKEGKSSPVIKSVTKRNPDDIRRINEDIERKQYDIINKAKVDKEVSDTENELSSIKRRDLAKYLKERIIGNDSLLDDLSTVIVSNFRTDNPRLIKNILCVGSTGSGKSETFRLISEYANLPLTTIDVNQLTAEGYVGKSVDDIFKKIYVECDGDMNKAKRSILFLDEIDKIASRGANVKDIDVQHALLKVLEGFKYTFERKNGGSTAQIDTSLMTKVGAGAFMELFDKNNQKHALGFNQEDEKVEDKKLVDYDIIKYGFLPEFVGRFPIISTYRILDENALFCILTDSKISPLNIIKSRLQEEYGTTIEWDLPFLDEIVQAALKTEAGGRSLNKIITQSFIKLEGALIDEMDEGHEIPKVLKLNKEMIKDPTKFNL